MNLHSYTHTQTHTYNIHTYIQTYVIHIYIYIFTYLRTYIHTYVSTFTHTHTHTHISIHTYVSLYTYTHTYINNYLLTPWCRVLLEKLTGLQLVKKFPAFHGTRRFITALTSVRHLSLSWDRPIQSIYSHPTSWRSILILFTHLRLGLPSGLFPSGFPTKTPHTHSPHPCAPHAQPISFFSILSPAQYWARCTNHTAPRYAISSIPQLPRPS